VDRRPGRLGDRDDERSMVSIVFVMIDTTPDI
jgi:hypothetical protein